VQVDPYVLLRRWDLHHSHTVQETSPVSGPSWLGRSPAPQIVFDWLLVSGFGFRVFGFRVSGFGFRVSGFGFRVSSFGFRVSGIGYRVSGFGFRVSGFGAVSEEGCGSCAGGVKNRRP
jgi:hypothetical protein